MTEKTRLNNVVSGLLSRFCSKTGLTHVLSVLLLLWALPALAQTWVPTGSMGTDRRHATVTRLQDGRILVVGGVLTPAPGGAQFYLDTAEIYDPATGQFSPTESLVTGARALHTATLLLDGTVLVAGGYRGGGGSAALTSAEIYDPSSGTFSATTGPLNYGRGQHTATLLKDGKVLIAGGYNLGADTRRGEIYDPSTGTFTLTTDAMVDYRNGHRATLLTGSPMDGLVLITGGFNPTVPLNTATLYRPATDTFIDLAPGTYMLHPRASHSSTLLPDGRVLLAGGTTTGGAATNTAEIFDPAGGVPAPPYFTLTANNLGIARQWHTAISRSDGKVLIAGGNNDPDGLYWWYGENEGEKETYLSSCELYDPATETFASFPSMNTGRSMFQVAMLNNGEVLVPGGGFASAELYTELVAYYPFNGNANDESGYGNHGTVDGAILTEDRFGNLNSSYSFDGSDDGIIIPNSDSLDTDSFQTGYTIAAWIKRVAPTSDYRDIVKKNQGLVGLRLNGNRVEASHCIGATCPVKTDLRDLLTETWYHVAVTWDDSTNDWIIYVDGAPSSISSIGEPLHYGAGVDSDVTIGRDGWHDRWYFIGMIDDIFIYTRALSQFEIQQLMLRQPDPCAALGGDTDGDGICDDGDGTGTAGDHPCTAGNTVNCDDNCPDLGEANPDQADQDKDGIGDICDDTAMGEMLGDKPELTAVVATSPDGSISVSVTVTLKPINWDPNHSAYDDTYYVKPDPYNVLVRLFDSLGNEIIADQVLCGPPCSISIPGDLVEVTVADGPQDYSTVVPLSEWHPNLPPGDITLEVSYINQCDDQDKDGGGGCPLDATPPSNPDDSDCYLGIWRGRAAVEEDDRVDFSVGPQNAIDQCPDVAGDVGGTGCPFADYNYVALHSVYLGKGPSSKDLLSGAEVRVFDRNAADFQTEFGSNPKGSMYGVIFEPPLIGYVGACITDANGECYVGEAQTGDYLVIVRYEDFETGDTVYVGRPKGPSDFVDGIAEKEFQFIKVYKKNGEIVWRGGSKTVVNGSYLEIISPDSAIWEGTQSVYPFIFTSDSDWSVDVCAEVPDGYSIVGVYDENGDLIPSAECVQTFVSGETKTVAFEVQEIGSPEPWLGATLNIVSPKGLEMQKKVTAHDIRIKTFKAKLKEKKAKKKKN